jgi:hypothetical protein
VARRICAVLLLCRLAGLHGPVRHTEKIAAMRDDINKLPLSKDAKAYARRTGLKSMMDQPKQFMKVNAQILNPGKPNVMKNYEVGEQTDGKKGAPKKAFKESAGQIVDRLLND